MSKICFVVQRYGLEVNGGAELLCRQLAEKMASYFDIEIITTKAKDYLTWKNEYPNDVDIVNGLKVLRFPNDRERDEQFNEINNRFITKQMKREEEPLWLNAQGPYCPSLIEYIRNHKDDYDVFVFFTYLYYPTVAGIEEVANKSIVFPFAHDEPYIQMKQFNNVFKRPAAICFQTVEERDLIQRKYRNYDVPYVMGGAGVEVPANVSGDDFKKKYNLNNYIIYVGRVDYSKSCGELFDYFLRFKKEYPSDLKLVLLGKAGMEIPNDPAIVPLGFVSDQDKFDGIAGSKFLVLPSHFESLSIVVLEAFSLNIPVLVSGHSPVLKGHCIRSKAGMYFTNYRGFVSKSLQMLMHDDLRYEMGIAGKKYVNKNYRWDLICQKLAGMIDYVSSKNVRKANK